MQPDSLFQPILRHFQRQPMQLPSQTCPLRALKAIPSRRQQAPVLAALTSQEEPSPRFLTNHADQAAGEKQ